MMLRTRAPAGIIPWQLYLVLDRLADQYGNGTLRATARQGFQIHGILKENLKTAIRQITEQMGSTAGACGDINRNVMAPPPPFKHLPAYHYAREYAVKIADLLAPQGGHTMKFGWMGSRRSQGKRWRLHAPEMSRG